MSRKSWKNCTLEQKLFRRREISEEGCWLWLGATTKQGYGMIWYKERPELVHRVAAMIWLGYDLKTYTEFSQVNHKRECKNKNCFNPGHLYIGSQSQNIVDSVREGTHFPFPKKREA